MERLARTVVSQSPRGRGRYSTINQVSTRQTSRGLNPLAVGVGIQLQIEVLEPLVATSQSPRGRGRYSTCATKGRKPISDMSQSPRARGRYSTRCRWYLV